MNEAVGSRKTIERSDEAWLSWGLQFGQADVQKWQPSDWLDCLDRALTFLAEAGEPSTYAVLPLSGSGVLAKNKPSLEEARVLLQSAHKALRRFIGDLKQSLRLPLMDALIPFKGTSVFFVWAGKLEVRYIPREKTITKQFTVEMLLRLGELSRRVDLSRLSQCPGCDRLFIVTRSRRFDTPECRMRHRIRLLKR